MKAKACLYLLVILTTRFFPAYCLTWSTPILDKQTDGPLIAIDHLGNVLEVSKQNESGTCVIQAQTYKNDTNTWSKPVNLSAENVVGQPRMAVDPAGNAIVIWQVSEGVYDKVQSAFYHASTDKWTQPKNLSTLEKNVFISHLAMNEKGDAFAAWKAEHENQSKTITYSRTLDKWSQLESRILPAEAHDKSKIFKAL